jgi:ABC-2 type transport system permease protein
LTTTRTSSSPLPAIAGVAVTGGTIADDLRAARMVWKRELIRYSRNRVRIVTSLAQPVLFLFVLGSGLGPIIKGGSGPHVDFKTFLYPGVIAMTILFTAIFSAVSIVWDREFGFLREMMVAPIRRGALVTGKTLGGATVATMQGVIMLLLGPLVHVPYEPVLILELLGLMLLCAAMITSIGVLAASRIQQVESFQVVMQLFVLPMFFLAGAVFPLNNLPRWLSFLTKIRVQLRPPLRRGPGRLQPRHALGKLEAASPLRAGHRPRGHRDLSWRLGQTVLQAGLTLSVREKTTCATESRFRAL